jgi:hypothetical protein
MTVAAGGRTDDDRRKGTDNWLDGVLPARRAAGAWTEADAR